MKLGRGDTNAYFSLFKISNLDYSVECYAEKVRTDLETPDFISFL